MRSGARDSEFGPYPKNPDGPFFGRLGRRPSFTLTVVLTLALGIGANAAIFSIADGVLFRPLPYGNPDGLFVITMMDRQSGAPYWNVPDEFVELVRDAESVGSVGVLGPAAGPIVQGADGPETVDAAAATAEYFDVLGVEALYGRTFDPEDLSSGGRPALLSHASWQQRFGGREDVVGTPVRMGNTTFDIVGILPPGLIFPSPIVSEPEIITVQASWNGLNPAARLRSGISREEAQNEIDSLALGLAGSGRPVLTSVRNVLFLDAQPATRFLLGSAVLVFLIGCAHLTNLLLARSQRMSRETGIRGALGASRVRLVRPLMFEALLLGLAGSVVALVVTTLAFPLLLPLVPSGVYGKALVGVSPRVILFGVTLGLLGGVVSTLVPAWRSANLDPLTVIRGRISGEGRGRHFGRPMLAVQAALSLVLIFGLAVSVRTIMRVRASLGFDPENVAVVTLGATMPSEVSQELGFGEGEYGLAQQAFYVQAVERVSGLADVVSVGAVGSRPFDGSTFDEGVENGLGRLVVGLDHVLPGYFEAAGIDLLEGRLPDRDDLRTGTLVAVLSESAARTLYGRDDPVGRTFENPRGMFTVIGVVSDVLKSRREEVPGGYVLPGARTPRLQLVVRTRTQSDAVLRQISDEVSALAPTMPLRATWWGDAIAGREEYRNPRFATLVLGGFSAVALALTAVGVGGLVAFLVVSRKREMGIRLALGAGSRSLVGLMIRQTLVPVTAGIVLGVLITPPMARLAESRLFEIDSGDPSTLLIAVITVVAVAIVASWIPSRSAGRIDTMSVLKSE